MLELLLLRHGEAGFSLPDRERTLTERGQCQTRQVLQRRAGALVGLSALYVSPYRRALQTAELVRQLSDVPAEQCFDGLQPDSEVDALLDWLQPQQGRILLVAHNPLLSRLLNRLIGEPRRYHFDTSTLVSLTMAVAAADCATLNWIESPC